MTALAQETRAAEVVLRLRSLLGSGSVLSGADVPVRNRQDWSTLDPVTPLAVVRPADSAGVAAALRVANEYGIAVVPQGGLTGLAGGARPIDGALALSTERLVGIEEINSAAATITARAGATLQAVQEAAEAAGFYFPLDLGSRGSCTIGGNIATNAGGNRVLRYGMMREMVLGLEAALPDGTLVSSMNKLLKNNAGYDLKHLFIGSEGTLGIVTRAVLRLRPQPAAVMAALCGLASYEATLALLSSARNALGPVLSAFEVMWSDYWAVAMKASTVRDPLAGRHAFYVLVEAQGSAPSDEAEFDAWLESSGREEARRRRRGRPFDRRRPSVLGDAGRRRRTAANSRAARLIRHRPAGRRHGRLRRGVPPRARRADQGMRKPLLRAYCGWQHAYRRLHPWRGGSAV